MGEKYRAQIKRSRTKTRSTAEGMLYHRMSQSVRSALRGAKRKCKWEDLLGYSVEELKAHLEAQFTEGMTWDKFLWRRNPYRSRHSAHKLQVHLAKRPAIQTMLGAFKPSTHLAKRKFSFRRARSME
jgi:hypothetical protein